LKPGQSSGLGDLGPYTPGNKPIRCTFTFRGSTYGILATAAPTPFYLLDAYNGQRQLLQTPVVVAVKCPQTYKFELVEGEPEFLDEE
jgi:hypothetical protein